MKTDKNIFPNVLGYEEIKRELIMTRSWFLNPAIVSNEKIILPKGVLFYGDPGCGKTLFMREYAKSFNWPVIVIEGTKSDEVITDIQNKFAQAHKAEHAIVIIDEIDLLINDNKAILRALQTGIDGFEKMNNILVLATTNHIYNVPDPLKRVGRFDRRVYIDYPDNSSRIVLFKKFLDYYDMDYQNVDFTELVRVISKASGADIQGICNDSFIRIGKITTTDSLIESYNRVVKDIYLKAKEPTRNYQASVHEAGHVLLGLKHNQYGFFHDAKFTDDGAETYICPVNNHDSFARMESQLQTAFSGVASEKVIFGKYDYGSGSDFEKARNMCYRMIENHGYKGIDCLSNDHNSNNRYYVISNKLILKKEKTVQKMCKKCFKEVFRFLKRHKNDILKVANFLYKNGSITYKDIPSLNLSDEFNKKEKVDVAQIILHNNKSQLAHADRNSSQEIEPSVDVDGELIDDDDLEYEE